MFAIGFPIGGTPVASSTRLVVDQIVVSVGPYMFQSCATLVSRTAARSIGMASPPQSALMSDLPLHPASSKRRQVEGVACMTVT